MENTARIYGNEIFFNFIEIDYSEVKNNPNLIKDIQQEKLAGFITKNVFSLQEVEEIKTALANIPQEEKRIGPMAELFHLPFTSASDSGDRLNAYINKAAALQKHRSAKAIDMLLTRFEQFFTAVGHPFEVQVTRLKNQGAACAAGNFRSFFPNKGGFYVHCEYFIQKKAPFYYQLVEPLSQEGQLSYLVQLQNSEVGGELTLYNMLWKDIQDKEKQEDNEYVIDKSGKRIYLKDVKHFSVNAQPGDVVVFSGGPIWHRVEDILGTKPRITYGGFLKFTADGKGLRYWG